MVKFSIFLIIVYNKTCSEVIFFWQPLNTFGTLSKPASTIPLVEGPLPAGAELHSNSTVLTPIYLRYIAVIESEKPTSLLVYKYVGPNCIAGPN